METKIPKYRVNLSKIEPFFKISDETSQRSFDPTFQSFDFDWQPRFHEHIIRNDESYQRISEYIQNNPVNWHADKFYNES